MIFVDKLPFSSNSYSSQGNDTLFALLEHPILISASSSLKATPERRFSVHEESPIERSKGVYIFQREYATVDPALVDFVGPEEATTCVGLVIQNRQNGMTSVAHMDSPKVVDMALSQMLSLLVNHNSETELDQASTISQNPADLGGYSLPLCAKILQTLCAREKFHIQNICVLGHNTKRDSNGTAYPIFKGFVVDTWTSVVMPASFDRSSRCPDEIVRRIRVSAAYADSSWNGKLLETYDTLTDKFKIAPCCWTVRQCHIALMQQHRSDSEILSMCSISPTTEGPDFMDNLRRFYVKFYYGNWWF